MADKTGIEWTDATWNPLAGCSLVSPGCTNCYAMVHAHRLLDKPGSHYEGTTKKVNGTPVWTGKIAKAPDHIMEQPLRWSRPRMVFVNSMSDLFHEDVPDEWIDEVFAIMALAKDHTFQILTKRAERMREYMEGSGHPAGLVHWQCRVYSKMNEIYEKIPEQLAHKFSKSGFLGGPAYPLPNVWLGVSVEDQRRANERIRPLLNTPAAVRFLSMEPLVGPVDLNALVATAIKDPEKGDKITETCLYTLGQQPAILPAHDTNKIDWVIVGGESGGKARPMHPDWVRYTRDQCITAGVAFFFKQWGHWAPLLPDFEGRGDWFIVSHGGGVDIPDDRWPDEAAGECPMVQVGKKKAGNTLDGKTWQQIPERKTS